MFWIRKYLITIDLNNSKYILHNMETVKGFSDYTGEQAIIREKIAEIIREYAKKYGFEPVETPVIEYEEFVKGNNQNDEAVSDIYKLQDKGKRKLALRYEFTFQLKRISKNKKLPYKRYEMGYVFRDEPTTGNRFRQITQFDLDIIGSSIKDEAELLKLNSEILKKLNIEFSIYFNNRKLLNEILEELKIKNKNEVIREIDKLDKLPEKDIKANLKKYNADKIIEIFKKPEKFFEKYKSYEEIKELKKYCDFYNIKINFLPSLARGLSYYNGTIFEIKTKKFKETICAGGSYLINNVQSTGTSFGIDRLSSIAKIDIPNIKYLVVSMGKDKEAIKILTKLREKNSAMIMYGKITKALDYANKMKIEKVIIVGENELKEKKVLVKDMKSGKEQKVLESKL